MADYIVIVALTPICSYIFQRMLEGTKFTVLKTSCCLTVVVGILLVVQPQGWFGEIIARNETVIGNNSSSITDELYHETNQSSSLQCRGGSSKTTSEPPPGTSSSKFSLDYFFGVAIGLTYALAGALGNCIPSYCKTVSTKVFMLWGGFGSIIISFVLPLIPKLEVNTVFNTLCLSALDWFLIVLMATVALCVQQVTVLGTIWATPTIFSMVRRTEILYVLVIDMAYFGDFPNALGVAGYIIVFASVVGMSAAAKIENG